MSFLPDITGIRPRLHCRVCGGSFITQGPRSRRVPHADWCPRKIGSVPRKRPQPGPQLEEEGAGPPAALRPTGSNPVAAAQFSGPVRWPAGPSAVSDMVREPVQRRKKF